MARRGKTITAEDRELWQKVAKTTKALHLDTFRPEMPKTLVAKPNAAPPKIKPFSIGDTASTPKVQILLADSLLEKTSLQMDRRSFERLRKGRLRPEAYLDLHGMTAEAAHARLGDFIISAHLGDLRLVLVITGKGRIRHEDVTAMPVRKGVLRHSVPHWLAQPGLKARILQVTPAHDKHGGGGALYVYLRRRRAIV